MGNKTSAVVLIIIVVAAMLLLFGGSRAFLGNYGYIIISHDAFNYYADGTYTIIDPDYSVINGNVTEYREVPFKEGSGSITLTNTLVLNKTNGLNGYCLSFGSNNTRVFLFYWTNVINGKSTTVELWGLNHTINVPIDSVAYLRYVNGTIYLHTDKTSAEVAVQLETSNRINKVRVVGVVGPPFPPYIAGTVELEYVVGSTTSTGSPSLLQQITDWINNLLKGLW